MNKPQEDLRERSRACSTKANSWKTRRAQLRVWERVQIEESEVAGERPSRSTRNIGDDEGTRRSMTWQRGRRRQAAGGEESTKDASESKGSGLEHKAHNQLKSVVQGGQGDDADATRGLPQCRGHRICH